MPLSEKVKQIDKILKSGQPMMTHYAIYSHGVAYKLCAPGKQLSGAQIAKKGKAAVCRRCRKIKED